MSCIICHNNAGKLTCLRKKGLLTLIQCAVDKDDFSVSKLQVEEGMHYVHEKCRSIYLRPIAAVKNADEVKPLVTDEEKVFCWDKDCFLCSKSLKLKDRKGLLRKVSQVSRSKSSEEGMDSKILSICRGRTDEATILIGQRVSSVSSLNAVCARYHQDCMSVFRAKKEPNVVVSAVLSTSSRPITPSTPTPVSPVRPIIVPTTSLVTLPALKFDDLFIASSHHEFLMHFAIFNSFHLVNTLGGGACFFDSVSKCLSFFNIFRSISELRLAASIELGLNYHLYAALFHREQNAVGQASSYQEFVRRTRDEDEWATELTICAMCKAIDFVIRVVSTDTNLSTGVPTGFVQNYSVGVRQLQRVIVVGFNKHTAHYVAFVPASQTTAAPVVVSAVSSLPVSGSIQHTSVVRRPVPMDVDVVVLPLPIVRPVFVLPTVRQPVVVLPLPIVRPVVVLPLPIVRPVVVLPNVRQPVVLPLPIVRPVVVLPTVRQPVVLPLPIVRQSVSATVASPVQPSVSHHTVPMDVDQLSESEDNMPMDTEAQSCSVVGVSYDEQCENCLRVGTASVPMTLHPLEGPYTKRNMSFLTGQGSYLLCSECRTHLGFDGKVSNSKLWTNGWPSVISYLLHYPKHADISNQLWNILPSVHQESWPDLSHRFTSNHERAFHDFTAESKRYIAQITSGSIGDFICSQDENAFPNVKCPAGCMAYTHECSPLPFNHFLVWKFGISIFGGDSDLLTGARADWPMRSLQLEKFVVAPGVIIDEHKGMCILLCSDHHGALRKSIIHVPRNPILMDRGYQRPDIAAAAVLTPNVVRSGKLGRWTNSSHSIKAVGGYGGISSSYINQQVDNHIIDERCNTATFLAVRNRADVYNTIQQRCLDQLYPEYYEEKLRWYDNECTPSPQLTRQCLEGATLVLVSDALAMHNNFFDRGSKGSSVAPERNSVVQEKKSTSLLFVVVHPANDEGRRPYDTSSAYPLDEEHVVLGALIRLVLHSPSVHRVLLKSLDSTGSPYLQKFLGFVKKQACKGHRYGAAKSFSTIKVALQHTTAELARLNVVSNAAHCQLAAALLCDMAPDQITSHEVPQSCALEDLVLPSAHSVVIFYRLSNRTYRDPVPLQIGQLVLMAAFGEVKHLSEFIFRWDFDFQFWKVTRRAHSQSTQCVGREFECRQWQMLVYVDRAGMESMNDELTNSLGGQTKMRCDEHDQFLAKQSIHCTLVCNVKHCKRTARYRCLARGLGCPRAVCFSHARDIMRGDVSVDVEPYMTGRLLSSRVTVVPSVSAEDPSSSSSSGLDSDVEIFAPIGQEEACDDGDLPALHSRRDVIPIYDVNRRIASHFLWNKGYGVLRRRLDRLTNVQATGMMQHIVSITDSPCVSLMYVEGQLFPQTFWKSQGHSVVGAVPSFMLNCFSNTAEHGIASLDEHHAIRLRDGDLLTAKQNPYWHMVFDVSLNQQLNRYSSKLVFKRGLEFLLEKDDGSSGGGRTAYLESQMPMDEAESTRRIRELASLLKKGPMTYFVTITINESNTPGVRVITEAINQLSPEDDSLKRELNDAFLPFILRVWERFVRVLLQELVMRNHTILGEIDAIFSRWEFQTKAGNPPHSHNLVRVKPEPESDSLRRICCNSICFGGAHHGCDYDTLHSLGVFQDKQAYDNWCTIWGHVNTHDCARAGLRCMKNTDAHGNKVCRVRRQPPTPSMGVSIGDGWFRPVDQPYTEKVFLLLQELDLASKEIDLANPGEERWVLGEDLKAGKYHYHSNPHEFFIASIPILSAITQSSCNVDACSKQFAISYLVSYVNGKEERQQAKVIASKHIQEVTVTTEEHQHEKIRTCRKLAEEKAKNDQPQGREIALSEICWYNLKLRYTWCTADFVNLCTLPLAHRAAMIKQFKPTVSGPTAHEKRVAAGLLPWRQFTDSQQAHADEYSKSSLSLDATSAFNIRPAELIIFDDLQLYHECFVAARIRPSNVTTDLAGAAWLDGAGRSVKLNSCSLHKCLSFLRDLSSKGNRIAGELLDEVFEPLERGDPDLERIFVKPSSAREIVSVISLVKPWDRSKFFAHLCLSLGRYVTEMDVFCSRSVTESFFNAGLLPSASVVTRDDVLVILRRYVVSDLCFHPITARQFNKYLISAYETLIDVLIDGSVSNYSEYMSEVMLKDQATEQLAAFEKVRTANLIDALYDDPALARSLPTDLRSATIDAPLQWTPVIMPAAAVSPQSLAEQTKALGFCIRAIDRFMEPGCRGVKFPMLVGLPGSGKSFCLSLATAYCLSKGLKVELMAFTSERARKLGGNHMHMVFPLEVSRSTVTVTSSIAYQCLKTLQLDPMKQALIKRTDVFLYEEIGLLSSQLFCALDSVLQAIMQNSLPFGGKLLISSGDSKQLRPITGEPIWSSALMCTIMEVIVFKSDVRARDQNLRWLNAQCRRTLDATESAAVAECILSNCTIVDDWAAVPDNAVRIVSTRAAERSVMDLFLASKVTTDFIALDEVQNNTAWIAALPQVTRRLDAALYEYAVCRLFLHAIMRMTYNERRSSNRFSQGQLAIVTALPDVSLPFALQKLTLRLAPPCFRQIDPDNIPSDWPEIRIGRRTTPPLVVGRCLQMGRRTQFPVKFHLTSTIHRCQGETISLCATQISEVDRHYRLWQREQLTVLISRAQRCADMIFVGSRMQTREAIIKILGRTSKWDGIIDNYVASLDVLSHPLIREVRLELHPFLPLYRELPTACCGYVYLIASIAVSGYCFLGEAVDLKRALREHNTGYGDEKTRPTRYHPFGVYAFICGFERAEAVVEAELRLEVLRSIECDLNEGPENAYAVMKDQVAERNALGTTPFVIVKCGELR